MDKIEDKKLEKLKLSLEKIETEIKSARVMLSELIGIPKPTEDEVEIEGKIIEGKFDGENMVAGKKKYPVPINYASKSKLVEGDLMKLTITKDGTFVYKQIGPVERKNLIGILTADGEDYHVIADGKSYKVLLASVTYYKAKPGDKVAIMVPAKGKATWAAVENLVEHAAEKPAKTPDIEKEKIVKRNKKAETEK